MPPGFAVNLTELDGASQRVSSLSEQVREGTHDCFAPTSTDFGHPELEDAVTAAHGRWGGAASARANHAETLGVGLSVAASTYSEADEAAADRLSRLESR